MNLSHFSDRFSDIAKQVFKMRYSVSPFEIGIFWDVDWAVAADFTRVMYEPILNAFRSEITAVNIKPKGPRVPYWLVDIIADCENLTKIRIETEQKYYFEPSVFLANRHIRELELSKIMCRTEGSLYRFMPNLRVLTLKNVTLIGTQQLARFINTDRALLELNLNIRTVFGPALVDSISNLFQCHTLQLKNFLGLTPRKVNQICQSIPLQRIEVKTDQNVVQYIEMINGLTRPELQAIRLVGNYSNAFDSDTIVQMIQKFDRIESIEVEFAWGARNWSFERAVMQFYKFFGTLSVHEMSS